MLDTAAEPLYCGHTEWRQLKDLLIKGAVLIPGASVWDSVLISVMIKGNVPHSGCPFREVPLSAILGKS